MNTGKLNCFSNWTHTLKIGQEKRECDIHLTLYSNVCILLNPFNESQIRLLSDYAGNAKLNSQFIGKS